MKSFGKAPCMGCEDRHEACHSKCEDYKAWNEKRKEKGKELHDIKVQEYMEKEFRCARIRAFRHKGGGKA